jgi:hypothetical protein
LSIRYIAGILALRFHAAAPSSGWYLKVGAVAVFS